MPRRFWVKKDDWEKIGHTAERTGRRAANRGTTAVRHAEECRERTEEEAGEIGDERTERVSDAFRLRGGGAEQAKGRREEEALAKQNAETRAGPSSFPGASSSSQGVTAPGATM